MDGMDDLTAKLSELLDSPEGMSRVKAMADSLLGGSGGESNSGSGGGAQGIFNTFSPGELETIMRLGSLLKSDTEDSRAQLLMALKPHLSAQRQDRVDRAVKLLRIASILPLISQQGLF